jgi:hypothetical protein
LIHLHISPDCRERRPFRFNTLRADSRPFASHLFWRTPLTTGFCEALVTEFWLTDLPDERLLTKPQTAALLGASIDTLDRWATRGRGRPRLRAIAGSFRSSQMLSTLFVLAGSTLIVIVQGAFLSLLEWIRSYVDAAISAPFQRAAASFAEQNS